MKFKQRDDRLANQPAHLANKSIDGLERFLQGHYRHTAGRLKDRHKIVLSYDEWEALNQRIYDERDVRFLFKTNTITAVYRLVFKEKELGVMFSTQTMCVTTVVPTEDCRLELLKPNERVSSPSVDGIRSAHFE
jgi:hypothetical protein